MNIAERMGMMGNIPRKIDTVADVDRALAEWKQVRPLRHDGKTPIYTGLLYEAWRKWGDQLLDRRIKAAAAEAKDA
jgi:hypothetical protein